MSLQLFDGWQRKRFIVDGWVYHVPSKRMLSEIIGNTSIESQELFQKHSNFIVNRLTPPTETEQALCLFVDSCWQLYQRHTAIVEYVEGVLPQQTHSVFKSIDTAQAIDRLWHQYEDSGEIRHIPDKYPSEEVGAIAHITEYRCAAQYLNAFWQRVVSIADDPIVAELIRQFRSHYSSEAAKNRNLLPSPLGQKLLRQCPHCGEFFEFARSKNGKLPPSCKRPECQRVAAKLKPSQQKRLIPKTEWVPRSEKAGRCRECRSNAQRVNEDRICKPCFLEPLS